MHKFSAITLAFVFCLSQFTSATAQPVDFFWSEVGPGQGATNQSHLNVVAGPGESVTLYLYYTTNGPLDSDLRIGALLDITSTDPSRVRFVSAEVLEFDIKVVDIVIEPRWDAIGGTVSDEMIDEFGAFSFFGSGILEANDGQSGPFFDEGYDPSSDAFLFGQIEVEMTGVGPVKIITKPGNGLVVGGFNCGQLPLEPTFTTVTIGPLTLPLSGDINQDGAIDLLDVQPFVNLIANGGYLFEADVICDGSVNLLDVAGFVAILTGAAPPTLPIFGDVNRDGSIDLLDVEPFLDRLTNSQYQVEADVNQDGSVDLLDVDPFVALFGNLNGPTEGPDNCLLGDVNNDGVIDLLDVEPFSQLILNAQFQCEGDLNQDGEVNLLDIPCLLIFFAGG